MVDLILDVCWSELGTYLNDAEFDKYSQYIRELTGLMVQKMETGEIDEAILAGYFADADQFGYELAIRQVPIEVLLHVSSQLRKTLVEHLSRADCFRQAGQDGLVLLLDVSSQFTHYSNHLIMGYNRRRNDEMKRLYELQRNVVLDSLPITVVVYDEEGHCIFVNKMALQHTGLQLEDVLGKPRQELAGRYNRHTEPEDTWSRVLAGTRVKLRNESLEEDGLSTHEKELIPLLDDAGKRIGVVSANYPAISEKERLYHMQKQFSFVLNSMNSGLLVLNSEFVVAAFNKKAEEIFLLEAERVLATNLEELFTDHIEVDGEELMRLHSVMEHGKQIRDIERTVRIKGREVTLRISGNPIKNSNGTPVGYIVILDDLTELLAMQEAMVRNEKFALIGQFAAGIAHEIRNPLTTVFGFLQLFSSGRVQQEHLLDLTQKLLLPELGRANTILSDFLMVSKPQAPQRIVVDTGLFWEEVVRLVESEAHLRGVMLQVEMQEQLPNLYLDVQQMKQVFLNLCKNGFDVTPPGGTLILRVSLDAEGTAVRFDVIDEGPGIVAVDLSRIFEPFYTTKDDGTGLGLPISHRIVDGHGGSLNVRSMKGDGTMFTVTIPLNDR